MSTILLVDDNEDIREIFTIFLSTEGHTIHSAPGGRQCLEMLSTLRPDLILLDIMMPGMDGWETLCAIKKNQSMQHLPVTMCSGKLPDLEEINRYGKYIEDYLVKPQELSTLSDSLVSIIQRCINRRREMECLKNETPEHLLIDEFYDCTKKLYILEKFSRFFTADLEKAEVAIQHHKARMYEIRENLNHPVLSRGLEPQPSISPMHDNAVFSIEPGMREPEAAPENLTKWTQHEDPTGLQNER